MPAPRPAPGQPTSGPSDATPATYRFSYPWPFQRQVVEDFDVLISGSTTSARKTLASMGFAIAF